MANIKRMGSSSDSRARLNLFRLFVRVNLLTTTSDLNGNKMNMKNNNSNNDEREQKDRQDNAFMCQTFSQLFVLALKKFK